MVLKVRDGIKTDFVRSIGGTLDLKTLGLAIARGDYVRDDHDDPYLAIRKFGKNPGIDTGTPEDVWDGSAVYVFPTTESTASIVSGSVEDDPDKGGSTPGTGAHEITVEGLDENWELASETLDLNGQDAVTTTITFIRVFRAYIGTVGTGLINAGDITITVDSKTVAKILADKGQTLMAVYSIPSGYTGYLLHARVSVGRIITSVVDFNIFWRLFGKGWRTGGEITVENDTFSDDFVFPPALPEKSDIRVHANVSANSTVVTSTFDMLLIKNPET